MKKENKEIVHEFLFNGGTCSLSTGKVAQRSNSAVIAKMGDTVVLVTVDIGDPIEGMDFFPLQVEYIERMYAGGLISSSRFVKRERFPSDDATLSARMLDRAIRSRFPEDYRNQMLVVLTILSYDPEHDPAIIGFSALSAALMASDAPFDGPIAGVRVGKDGDKVFVSSKDFVNPGNEDNGDGSEKDTSMNFVLSTDGEMVTMIDADAEEVSEEVIIEAMEMGNAASKELIDGQLEFIKKVVKERGSIVKPEYDSFALPKDLLSNVRKSKKKEITEALLKKDRHERHDSIEAIKQDLFSEFEGVHSKSQLSEACDYVMKGVVRELIVKEKKRVDGRKLDEVRQLGMELDVLPRAHGSVLFTRGGTQTMTVTTLASGRLAQIVDGMEGEGTRRYMHHYNAQDFTVGSAGRYRYVPKRREIGHGSLAEKALLPVLPDPDVFPYAIRVVSEIMSQNGSSSMASVCGSSMSLMDAGVPITRQVAGIAMGVVMSDDGKDSTVLTDIFEYEDYFGDMDFKVAGTEKGITAIQMDNKASGLPLEVFKEALEGAKKARMHILGEMNAVIKEPNVSLSKYAPKIDVITIPKDKIGELIGPGGKVIKGIIEDTGAEVDINDDGKVTVSAVSEESRRKALKTIEEMFEEPDIGRVYKGKVAKVMDFGAFVDISPSMSGLVHVSEMSNEFVDDPRKFVKEGQEVDVKVIGIDDRGRVKMSMKEIDKKGNDDKPGNEKSDAKPDKPLKKDEGSTKSDKKDN